MRIVSHLIAYVAGCVTVVALTGGGGRQASGPAVQRTYYDAARTQVHMEFPVDSRGLPHGEVRTYHPSGRLAGVTEMSHGQFVRSLFSDPAGDDHLSPVTTE